MKAFSKREKQLADVRRVQAAAGARTVIDAAELKMPCAGHR